MTQDMLNRSRRRHTLTARTLVALIAALIVALAVAAVVVSIGIARADTLDHIAGAGGSRLTLALVLAIVIAGMGGLTAAMVQDGEPPSRRD